MAQTIELFWDAVSPYTYLASTQIRKLAAECNAQLQWRPVFLGGIMQATGNRPPGTVPAKGKYLMTDIQRWAQRYGVPITIPKVFPTNSITAMRAACAAGGQPNAEAFYLALCRAYWGEGRDIGDASIIGAVASQVGIDGEAIIAAAGSDDIKGELRANTDEAVARGAFGAPSMFVGEAMFWGNDRLEHLRQYLQQDA